MSVPHSRIHILGLGSICTFTAHSLRDVKEPGPPAISLRLHRKSLYEEYVQNDSRITLRSLDGDTIYQRDYDAGIYSCGQWQVPSSTLAVEEIKYLVVFIKALKARLTRLLTILFLQNGCGMLDQVNKHLFHDPALRPNCIVGVISHGVALDPPFNVTHTGPSSVTVGLVPRAASLSYTDVLETQLEKLAMNAFSNSGCAMYDAKNAILFTFPELRRTILSEISNIILRLSELRGDEGVEERFSIDRLERTVNRVLERTMEMMCSMVVDLRHRREIEVAFINGYWIQREREVGVSVDINESLMAKILACSYFVA
ncbi:ketopantoate reductase PanE/ApbA C terminal-domain-containing protein [Aspergillus spinulosporus]